MRLKDRTLKNVKILESMYPCKNLKKMIRLLWIFSNILNPDSVSQKILLLLLFIGVILHIKPTEVQASLVKYSPTTSNLGKNFVFPVPYDKWWINKDDIIRVLNHPILQRRGQMKFGVNFKK